MTEYQRHTSGNTSDIKVGDKLRLTKGDTVVETVVGEDCATIRTIEVLRLSVIDLRSHGWKIEVEVPELQDGIYAGSSEGDRPEHLVSRRIYKYRDGVWTELTSDDRYAPMSNPPVHPVRRLSYEQGAPPHTFR